MQTLQAQIEDSRYLVTVDSNFQLKENSPSLAAEKPNLYHSRSYLELKMSQTAQQLPLSLQYLQHRLLLVREEAAKARLADPLGTFRRVGLQSNAISSETYTASVDGNGPEQFQGRK